MDEERSVAEKRFGVTDAAAGITKQVPLIGKFYIQGRKFRSIMHIRNDFICKMMDIHHEFRHPGVMQTGYDML